MSACGLMSRLSRHFHVTARPLTRTPDDIILQSLADAADRVGPPGLIPMLEEDEHVLFYMNEYPTLFANFSDRWRDALEFTASVQIVFNRTIGGLHQEHWLADVADRLYFHDSFMQHSWHNFTRDTPLAGIPGEVLPPPADLAGFFPLAAQRPAPPPLVVGRLAGDTDVPENAVSFYGTLADAVPNAEFWFMPAPGPLRAAFGNDPRFRFFEKNEMPVHEFLTACHVFALTYSGVPVPGPRSLMEAMAAGCAPVTIDRSGPRDRVVHGESGFRTNNDDEMIEHIVRLATDSRLREHIGRGAIKRAEGFDLERWITSITDTAIRSRDPGL